MKSIGITLREIREAKELLLREVAASISIDPTLLSKIERDERMPTKQQIMSLANYFKKESKEIFLAFLSDKVFYELKDEDLAIDALQIAEKKIKYLNQKKK